MKKYSWLIVGLLALGFSPAVLAINFVFPVDPQDQSLKFLGMLFGSMNQMPLEGNDAILPAIFRIFSYIALCLTLVIVVYSLFTAALNTAHEGKVLGSKFSVIFTPIRSILGIALLMPSSSGYAWIQILFMWVVINGIGAANGVWNTVINAYDEGISISNPNLSAPTNSAGFNIAKDIYALCLMTQYVNHVNTLPPKPPIPTNPTPEDLEQQKQFVPGITAKFTTPVKNIIYLAVPGSGTTPGKILFRDAGDDLSAPPETIYGTITATDFTKAIKLASSKSVLSNVMAGPPALSTLSDEKTLEINHKLQDIQITQIMTLLDDMNSNAAASMDLISTYLNKPEVVNLLSKQVMPTDMGSDIMGFLQALEPNSSIAYSLLQAASFKINALLNPLNTLYTAVYATEIPGYGAVPPSISEEARTVGWALAGVYYYKLASPPPPPAVSKDYTINVTAINPDAPSSYFLPKSIEAAMGCSATAPASYCADALKSLRSLSTNLLSNQAPGLKTPSAPPAVTPASSAFQTLTDSGDYDEETAESLKAIRGFSEDFSSLYKSLMADIDSFVNNPQEDPLMSLSILGGNIMGGIETFFFSFLAAIVVFGLTGGGACMSPVFLVVIVAIILLMPIILVFVTLLWGLAGMMAIYYPMVPYIIYLFAVFGWLLIVLEGVVAAPIVAIALTVPSEDDVGKLGATVTQWIAVFIRPALTVIGFILAARLFIACMQFFSNTFLSTLTGQLPGSSLFAAIPLLAMFVSTVGILIQRCFSATYLVPDQVIRWIGGTPDDTSAGEALSAAKGATEKTQQQTGQVISQTGKAISSSAKQGAQAAASSAAKGGA